MSALLTLSLPGPAATRNRHRRRSTSSVAPIALYPDALLGPMLLSAENPSRIGALSEWLRSHETLKGTALQDAAKASGFTDSYVALVLFPQVVNTMAEQLEWTTKIGQAFTADRSAVFGSIQRLRTKAKDAGKLKSNAQQSVTTEKTASGQPVIVIEPANSQIVYVPQYNPQTVYVPSTVVIEEDDDSDAAVAAGLIGFTAGIALGAAMDNDYYYGPYGWGGGYRMYDDAWDDWYDNREDAREDVMDHREDAREEMITRRLADERGDRARSTSQERAHRTGARPARRQPRSAPTHARRRRRSAPRLGPPPPIEYRPRRAAKASARPAPRPIAAAPVRMRSPVIRTVRPNGRPARAARAAVAAHAAAAAAGDEEDHGHGEHVPEEVVPRGGPGGDVCDARHARGLPPDRERSAGPGLRHSPGRGHRPWRRR